MIVDRKLQLNWQNRPSEICLSQGRLIGSIRAVGGSVRVGRTVQNTLKGGGTEMRGGKTKILKREASWVKGWVP